MSLPQGGGRVVNAQTIVIIIFCHYQRGGGGGRRGRANVTNYGVFLWMASLKSYSRRNLFALQNHIWFYLVSKQYY